MSSQISKHYTVKLVGITKLDLALKTITGLLIQAPPTAQIFRIGGADRYPMTTKVKYGDQELEVPYIPGSSLKGRIRALLEISRGEKLFTTDLKIWAHIRSLSAMDYAEFKDDVLNRNVVSELFGWAAANYQQIRKAAEDYAKGTQGQAGGTNIDMEVDSIFRILAPTRILVSEFYPTEKYVKDNNVRSLADFLEEKAENRIDRVTSAADPREVLRVRPGVEFKGTITMLLFEIDKDKACEYLNALIFGLELLEATYLGSSGSRGYGRVKVVGERATVLKVVPSSLQMIQEKEKEIRFSDLDQLKMWRQELCNYMQVLFS